MDTSIWQLLNHGGGSMWVVVAFSVIALAVAIERMIALYKFVGRASDLSETVNRCLTRGAVEDARSACSRSRSPMADIFLVGYERLGRAKADHVVTAVHRERQRVGQALRSRLWMLGTIGATAPFVGLFGTVVGIMSAMSGFKGDDEVRFSTVSGPISEALVVTAAGILVAVEAVILFNYFSQRAARIVGEMKLLTDEFLELLLETTDKPDAGKTQGRDDAGKRGGDDGDRQAA
ncbi:MAG: MotA/TolQ/ExbB proton channel family protein [Kofleriaceae bacterium]